MRIENEATSTSGTSVPAVRIWVKVVPGSRRDQVVGLLGERLKIKVTAPPEEGKANRAVCALLAAELGIDVRRVTVLHGHASAEKTVRIEGVTAAELGGRWG